MIKKQILLSFLLITFLILILNFKNIDRFTIFDGRIKGYKGLKQDYVGPIIFLQKNNKDISEVNCLDNNSKYQCVGRYPKNIYYPKPDEMKYATQPNIIRIPTGKRGIKGGDGDPGDSATSLWVQDPNIKKINSKDELSLNSNKIIFNNDVIMNEYQPICLIKTTESDSDHCINRETVINIINSFEHRDPI